MKRKHLLPISIVAFLAVLSSSSLSFKKDNTLITKAVISTNGCSYLSKLPTEIDLNPSSESEIRNYYSSLNSLSEDQLKGENLLKNLKPILFEMNYFSYSNIWKIYEITDRDWELSPANKDTYGDYDASSNKYNKYVYGSSSSNSKNNPYVHTLYRDPTNEDGRIREWGSHSANGTNREHVWCQSRGFSGADTNDGAKGPAGTDLHHLISGDGQVNQSIHNNNPYGFVKDVQATGNKEYTKNNKVGTALHTFGSLDESSVVFEPQDNDKGDIARAIFYMAARYNNLSGTDEISDYEPNLKIVNYATSSGAKEYSSATKAVTMGILQDLLVWNKMDPVDEYERYRNDLIYRNYQGNRNPFVDFPEWADYIWGVASINSYDRTPTGKANPISDPLYDASLSLDASIINLKTNSSTTIKATTINNSDVSWVVENTSVANINKSSSHSGEEITVSSLNIEGHTTLTCKAVIEGEEVSKTIDIVVSNKVVPSEDNEDNNGFKLDKKTLIIIGIAAVAVIILFIIIFSISSKKGKKKMIKGANKAIKYISKSNSKKGKRK